MRVLLVSANREKLPSPVVPLGPLSVAAALRDEHDVAFLDLCFEPDPHAALEASIESFDPEVIGIGLRNLRGGACDAADRLIAEYAGVVGLVREKSRAPIVLGGAAYSLRPQTLLTRLGGDYGIAGEGERSFRSVIDLLGRGGVPERITRAPAATAARPTDDLDRLAPPARELVDPRYYDLDGTDNVQTKRGCSFSCAYCDYPDLEGRTVRLRNPEAVADEVLERSTVPGITHVFFVDSVFNVPRVHALAICDALVERNSPLPWICYGSPVAFDEELVGGMARAGCQGVEIGSDAGTTRMLEKLNKPFSLAEIVRGHEILKHHGIQDCHTFVLGAFDETPDEARATLGFVEDLDPDAAIFILFTEDREAMTLGSAPHRDSILRLLADEAPRHKRWIVPELGIRFGDRIASIVRRRGLKGPSWLYLASRRS